MKFERRHTCVHSVFNDGCIGCYDREFARCRAALATATALIEEALEYEESDPEWGERAAEFVLGG